MGVPPLLDDNAQEWEEAARIAHDRCCEADDALESSASASTSREPAAEIRYDPVPRARRTEDGWLYLSEIVAPPTARNAEIEQEVQACFQELEGAGHCLGCMIQARYTEATYSVYSLTRGERSFASRPGALDRLPLAVGRDHGPLPSYQRSLRDLFRDLTTDARLCGGSRIARSGCMARQAGRRRSHPARGSCARL